MPCWCVVRHSFSECPVCILYCPEQGPMGARSSSTKNWGWVVTRRRCLNGSTIPAQAPIPDAKLAARVYQIDLHHHFTRASSRPARQWRKLYHARSGPTRSLVANLPMLVIREFCTAGKEKWEQGYGWVCVKP